MLFSINQVIIPSQPGCYLMKNSAGEILYIGKAKNLPKRVKSYWQKKHIDPKLDELITEVADIEFMVTRNEVEALLLEARLIKQHQPKYNSMLKENVPYLYIKITDEEFPRLVSVRKIEGPGKYFGPFVSGRGRKYLLLTTARLFGIRTNKLTSRSSRELYQLLSEIKEKQLEKLSPVEYQRNVKLADMFLRGKRTQLLGELEKRMKQASAEEHFELAKLYRDQIHAIKIIAEDQLVSLPKSYDQDVVNFVMAGETAYFQVFNVSKGIVTSRQQIAVSGWQLASQPGLLRDFLQQYYLTRAAPKEIVLPIEPAESALIEQYLEDLKSQKVFLTIPKVGDKKKLLELVRENILSGLANNPLAELQAQLGLQRLPLTIDGFDISNTSGQQAVGSCVRFHDGKPDKSMYRKFRIKTVEGPNDFAMMKEVVGRRYREGKDVPDLILIDGGKGQLGVATRALQALRIMVPVISLAKKQEEIFIPGREQSIQLDKNSPARKLLQQVRDEAHRFAISYHKLLRKRRG
ncbi:excinuclease ABC subunit UvrC [Candidatus Falkowbacteria bacterium]|nr:excinuclease ABC subunit UvrC [Candidatus Falkowbacteria bacterium]